MQTKIIGAVVLVCILFGLFVFIQSKKDSELVSVFDPYTEFRDAERFEFTNAESESVTVAFPEEYAILTGLGYTDLVLTQAISASGARYTNTEGFELWNKGNEITISKDGEILFTGSTEQSESFSLFDAWVWRTMVVGGDAVVEPSRPDAFIITFDSEGRVSGTTDCNSFSGAYTREGDVITVGPLASTKMFCADSQESQFTGALTEGPLTVSFEGGEVLVLRFSESTALFFDRIR